MASVPFMKPPDSEFMFDVGDTVEVYCDHEKMVSVFVVG
jgi:hypothetical protein